MTHRPGTTSISSAIIPVVAYCLLIFLVSNLDDPPAPDFKVEWGDKITHGLAYGGMMVLALRASGRLFLNGTNITRFAAAAIFCGLYGASDELHQYFVPGRNCDALDWLADATGILLALGAVLLTRRWRLTRFVVGDALMSNNGLQANR